MAGMPTQEELFDLYRKNNPVRRNVAGMYNLGGIDRMGYGIDQKDQTGAELATGLQGLFDAEGADALGTFVNIPGADTSFGLRKSAIRDLTDNVDFSNPEALKEYIKSISENTMGYDGLSVPVEGLVSDEGGFFGGGGPFVTPSGQKFGFEEGDNLSEMRKAYDIIKDNAVLPRFDQGLGTGNRIQENILEAEAAKIEALSDDSVVFDDPMEEISALIEEAKIEGGRGKVIEKPGERENAFNVRKENKRIADIKEFRDAEEDLVENLQGGLNSMTVAESNEAIELEKKLNSQEGLEEGFAAAWRDAKAAAGMEDSPKDGESKDDAIKRYKKEFSDATGIDTSGKVDKKTFLMSMGLSLLQNKAGKKFNLGKILDATGKAAEKAMPALDKARAEARAGQLAAGQYALNQRKSDVATERAVIASNVKFKKDLYMKFYDSSLRREEDLLNSKLTIQEEMAEALKEGKDFTKIDSRTYAVGQGPVKSWEVKYVYDSTNPNGGFLLKPENAIKKHIQGREGVTDARELITGLRGAAQEIAEGGGSQAFIYSKLLSLGKAVMPSTYLTGQPTNVEDYDKGVKGILAEFKRFLTQETGNGISDKDVEMWTKDLMGNLTLFSNLDATNAALDKLDRIFYRKEAEFDGALEELLDLNNHQESTRDDILKKFGTYEDLKGQGDLIFVDGKIQRVGS